MQVLRGSCRRLQAHLGGAPRGRAQRLPRQSRARSAAAPLVPDGVPAEAAPGAKPDPPQWERFFREVSQKLARDEAEVRPPRFRDAEIIYAIDRAASLAGQSVALDLMSRQRRTSGKWGRPKPAGVATRDVAQLPDPLDREIIPLLLGASDVYGSGYVSDHGRASFRL